MGRAQVGHTAKLDAVIFKADNKNGLKWYGEAASGDKQDKEDNLYDDDRLWQEYEEDEEARAKGGADRKDIKTISIDYRGTTNGNRSDLNAPLHSFECLTGFDFIYECPLMREFPENDFIRVSFGTKVPPGTVAQVLRNGLLVEDPHNSNHGQNCLYKFFGHSASQLRARSCILVNYDAKFWQEDKLSQVEDARDLKTKLNELDGIVNIHDRLRRKRALIQPSYIWKYFGNFSKIKVVAKYSARIGQLLSPTRCVQFIEDTKWTIERDIVRNGHEFTDGCGRMSTGLAKRFVDALNIGHRYKHQPYQVMSVLQIRIMGCKGILMHDPTLDTPDENGNLFEVVLRDSQHKFEWNMKTVKMGDNGKGATGGKDGRKNCRSELQLVQDKTTNEYREVSGRLLGSCTRGESRPFNYGRLNKQYVLLLKALGIPESTFLDVQKEHFDRLRRCLDDRLAAFEILCGNSKMEEADELTQLDEEDPIPPNVLTQLKRYRKPIVEMPQNENDENETKSIKNNAFYIPIPKSRNIYGVADISGKLRRGECFVQVTAHHDETSSNSDSRPSGSQNPSQNNYRRVRPSLDVFKIPDGVPMVVVKCPTYFAGDIRILKQRHIPELEHLVDVVVFPVDGLRPHPHEIHESDLDGDEYFVCWDQKLIPAAEKKPMPQTVNESKSNQKDDIKTNDLIEEFSNSDSQMGRINNLYMKWADLKGADCRECQQLAEQFATSVDQAKHGGGAKIAHHLRSVQDRQRGPDEPKLIQQKMIDKIMEQPYRAPADNLVRYSGLNNRFRRVPAQARYFVVDLKIGHNTNFHSMLKYGLWADQDDSIVQKLSDAVENTGRANQPAAMFGKSVFIIAYVKSDNREKNQRTFHGMAQLISKWQPLEWQNSPFNFQHRGAIHAHWVFCREFNAPKWIRISTETGLRDLTQITDGQEITKTAGDEIFKIFRDTPVKPKGVSFANGSNKVEVSENFLTATWPKVEKKTQIEIRRNRSRYNDTQQKIAATGRRPKN